MNRIKEENFNNVKINIIKKAILLGWIVTVFENNTIVIKKNKCHLSNFEKNTELLLAHLTTNDNFDTFIQKNIVQK